MKRSKKVFILLFVLTLVINLQLNSSVTTNDESNFSVEQLLDTIFFPSAFAYENPGWHYGVWECSPPPYYQYDCLSQPYVTTGCDPSDPDWGCDN